MEPVRDGQVRVRRALLSVDDKTGIAAFARRLVELGVELWSTSGTTAELARDRISARPLEELTGVGAWFGGRVKTLHPAVFGGILAPRTDWGNQELRQRNLLPFDLVAVNFYPFERRLRESPAQKDLEEEIDIGGVSLVRAAAKNHAWVAVITSPAQYDPVLAELTARDGALSSESRRQLAVQAFSRCTEYDAAIAGALAASPEERARGGFPRRLSWLRDELTLRYGENPGQAAAAYRPRGLPPLDDRAPPLETLKGDTPSFTNLLDLDTAARLVAGWPEPAAAVIKHATPCGVAVGATVRDALERAVATDPVARYGCAIAVNRPLEPDDPGALKGVFVDVLAAPSFAPATLDALHGRTKLKVIRLDPDEAQRTAWEAKTALGRLLVQETDRRVLDTSSLRLVTGPAVDAATMADLAFAWHVVRHAKSNAIVLAHDRATTGVGSGQPTRVKAVEIACEVAGPRAKGSVLASDAFFPFADGIEAAGRAGVAAVIQPGGSLRDPDVVAAAERYGMSMYFTGWRAFRH